MQAKELLTGHVPRMSIAVSIVLASLLLTALPQQQKPQFKVQVNVVSLDVEVLDPQGKPIDNLDQASFLVKENGSPVEISNFTRLSDVSLSLVVALGTSFMPQANLGLAKDAIFQIIHLLSPEDQICLFTFDQKDAYLEQGFTSERSRIINALDNIGVPARSKRPRRLTRGFAGPPQIGLGIDLGLLEARKGIYPRKVLLLIRDRVESLGAGSLDHVRESGCSLIALGFSTEAKNRLTLISDQSGSEQLILGAAEGQMSDENGNVTEICRTIAHLLKSRYNITYHTSLQEGQGPRRIEVQVPQQACSILARRTFVAPP